MSPSFISTRNAMRSTDKVRRRAVEEMYKPLIDRLYASGEGGRTVFTA